jgi:hypothetical protein
MAPHVQNPTSASSVRHAAPVVKAPEVLISRREASPMGVFARAISWEIRRLRTRFTRDNVIAFLKTLRWVVPLTILAWVYALSQQEEHVSTSLAVEVRSSNSKKVVTLLKDQAILCDLSGPRASLDRFLQSNTNKALIITIDAGNLPDTDNSIPIAENLKDNSRFKEAGITLTQCTPAFLTVNVDDLEKKTLPIQKPEISTLQSATFIPNTVEVNGPRSIVDSMTFVTADLTSVSIPNTPGSHTVSNVPLVQPSPEHPLSFSPSTVDATLVVQAADIPYDIRDIPVVMAVAPILLESHKITPSQSNIPKITVIGPPDQIDKLKQSDVKPTAVFEVTQDNISNPGPVSVTIAHLPDGVRLDGPAPQITFTATDIAR